MLQFNYNDGGRSNYFKAKNVGDCVTRSIAIATGQDYKEVYDKIHKLVKYSPRDGVDRKDLKKLMKAFGFSWHPTMTIGSGCRVHLNKDEIPMSGNIVCNLSAHLVAVIDGVVNDIYDCTREGSRCVYGYWTI